MHQEHQICGSGVGGGAGNPGGINSTGQWHAEPGKDGTGGLLIVYSNIIKNNGTISSNGMAGGAGEPEFHGTGGAGGGGSGGGSVNIFYKQMPIAGTITAFGGTGGSALASGGNGGNGCISKGSIETGTYVE